MITAPESSTVICRAFGIAAIGALLSMLVSCGGDSSDDNGAAGGMPADLTGTWMLTEVNNESFGAWSDNVLLEELKFRKTSRQLVTITQQGDAAQVQLCGDAAITASRSSDGLSFNAKIFLPTIDHVTNLTPIEQQLQLTPNSAGALHGTLDSGLIPVLSEPYPNSYQVTRDVTLDRISPDVNPDGIGPLTLDSSSLPSEDAPTVEQRSDTVNCFVETVRTEVSGDASLFYGIEDGPLKALMLDAKSVRVSITDGFYAAVDSGTAAQGARVKRTVALKLKPVFGEIGFSQYLTDLSAEEESSFATTSPLLLRQQYTSTSSSLNGTINVELSGQFMHAQFDLNW